MPSPRFARPQSNRSWRPIPYRFRSQPGDARRSMCWVWANCWRKQFVPFTKRLRSASSSS